MDQSKVNPFVGNTETSAGGSPVSATPTSGSTSDFAASTSGSTPGFASAPAQPAQSTQSASPAQPAPSVPVNPYAPAGAPYAPGSNTPAPSYADPISTSPAVPNTSSPDPAYTSFSPAPSQNFTPMSTPERPKLFTKKFVIFMIVGIILIAGAVVAGLMVQGGNKKGSSTQNTVSAPVETEVTIKTSSSALETLAYISNLMISGTESASSPDFNVDEWYISIVAESMADKDIITRYDDARKISKYFSVLDSLTRNNADEKIETLKKGLEESLTAYEDYLSIDKYEDDLTGYYLTKGINAATDYANELFSSISSNNASTSNILKRYYLDFLLGKVSLLDDYSKNGCITNNSIDQNCANQFIATFSSLKSQKLRAREYVAPIFESIKTELTELYNTLGGDA